MGLEKRSEAFSNQTRRPNLDRVLFGSSVGFSIREIRRRRWLAYFSPTLVAKRSLREAHRFSVDYRVRRHQRP